MEFLLPHHLSPLPHRLAHPASHSLHDRHPSPIIDEHGQCSRFPTSSDRIGRPASFAREPLLDSPVRYDPLGTLAQDERAISRKARCSSFTPRFFPSSVARGVLSNGTWTTEHPSIHAFLQSPSSCPSLTSRTSAAIYSLAALHVFYNPSHPSYDTFWRPDIKESTATFVHQVVTMEPSPISTAPITWLGVHDMLWQLTGIQKEYFRSQGGKPSAPPLLPTRRSLRKRKPVQALLQELSTREPSEVPQPAPPPRKKIKLTKSDESEKGSEATLSVALDQSDISAENKAGPSEPLLSKATKSSPRETRGNTDATPSPLTITSSLPPESQPPAKDDVTQAGTSRGRGKDATSKKAQTNPVPPRSSTRRTRERSPSFSSGSSTAVSAAGGNPKRARSSSSASSTSTTVDAKMGASGKGKGKEKADVVAEEETGEEDGGNDDDDEARKRSTRTRRSTAKEAGPKPSKRPGGARGTSEIDKVTTTEAPRRSRNRSGVTSSRSRKSRKT